MAPRFVDVFSARRRLSPFLRPTPLVDSDWLSSVSGAAVQLKLESLQPSHSFKIRGALNALLKLAETGNRKTIVTASAGNHGRAIAMAAERLGLPAVIFTPTTAPDVKKAAIRRHGAELRDEPSDYDVAEAEARRYAADKGALYISPYNHPDVIAGAGTLALELLEADARPDVLVVPLGGGGLASGLGIVLKAALPNTRIVGVEAEASMPFTASLEQGAIATINPAPSLADGLTGNLEPDSITFELVRQHVDALVSVSEDDLASAIRGLAAKEHLVAEGAGATAAAAVLARNVVEPGQRAVVLVTGGNIDPQRFAEIVVKS